jgi:biotin operon repressor
MLAVSSYQRTRHARITRSGVRVRAVLDAHAAGNGPAACAVLQAVRYLIRDGETRHDISQADIAAIAGVSEATVSKYMPRLEAAGYFRRRRAGSGRGRGYAITMLPPHELRDAPPAVEKGSLSDPFAEAPADGVGTPPEPPEKGSLSDPSIFFIHDHQQQQRAAHPDAAEALPNPPESTPEPAPAAADLPPATLAALQRVNAHPTVIARIAATCPDLTPERLQAEIAAASARPDIERPVGLALAALANGQAVAPSRPRHRTVATPRHADRVVDPNAHRGRPGYVVGDDPPPPEEEPDAIDPVYALARRLLPDAHPLDRSYLMDRLYAGADPQTALAETHARIAASMPTYRKEARPT